MNIAQEITSALMGMWAIIGRKAAASEKFNLTLSGFVTASWLYFALVLAGVLVASAGSGGAPGYWVIVLQIVGNLAPLAGLCLAIVIFVRLVRRSPSPLYLLVPATYALSGALVVSFLLSLVLPQASIALLGALAYVNFLIGRDIGRMPGSIALALALLSTVSLVIVPSGLYMLASYLR